MVVEGVRFSPRLGLMPPAIRSDPPAVASKNGTRTPVPWYRCSLPRCMPATGPATVALDVPKVHPSFLQSGSGRDSRLHAALTAKKMLCCFPNCPPASPRTRAGMALRSSPKHHAAPRRLRCRTGHASLRCAFRRKVLARYRSFGRRIRTLRCAPEVLTHLRLLTYSPTYAITFSLEAEMGFEPMNNGFANRRLGPLGYSADLRVGAGDLRKPPAPVNGRIRGPAQFLGPSG